MKLQFQRGKSLERAIHLLAGNLRSGQKQAPLGYLKRQHFPFPRRALGQCASDLRRHAFHLDSCAQQPLLEAEGVVHFVGAETPCVYQMLAEPGCRRKRVERGRERRGCQLSGADEYLAQTRLCSSSDARAG